MSPRALDLIAEAHQNIGNYVILKSDRTGTYRVEMVAKTSVLLTHNGVDIDLVTTNGGLRKFNAYLKVFHSRKEAEETAMKLNQKGEENGGN